MVAIYCCLAGVSDLFYIGWRQKLVVLRVQEVQELGCLRASGHSVCLVVHQMSLPLHIIKNILWNQFVQTKNVTIVCILTSC